MRSPPVAARPYCRHGITALPDVALSSFYTISGQSLCILAMAQNFSVLFLRLLREPAIPREELNLASSSQPKSTFGFISFVQNLSRFIRNQLRDLANGNGLSLFPNMSAIRRSIIHVNHSYEPGLSG